MMRFILPALVLFSLLPVFASRGAGQTRSLEGPPVYLPAIQRPVSLAPNKIHLEPYASGFETDVVVFIVNAGDPRLFVGEQQGRIRVVDGNGNVPAVPFLDIHNRVRHTNWEEGLQGLVFHPNYAANGTFYVSYNYSSPGSSHDGSIRVSRFQVSGDPNMADPDSEVVLMEIEKPPDPDWLGGISPVHNAGDMHFGPDGYLYIAIGDGGPDPAPADPDPGDPYNNGQRLNTLLGKMLRIDVNDGPGLDPDCGDDVGNIDEHYSIPFDNPFTGTPSACAEIWANGLRNPWRFSFDSLTGDIYIGDVGEWEREEINFQPAGSPGGQNYGWHCWEGTYDHTGAPVTQGDCDDVPFTFPVYEHENPYPIAGHSFTANGAYPGPHAPAAIGPYSGCSIIGGYVYRGSQYPALAGQYLFADLCSSLILLMKPGQWEAVLVNDLFRMWSTFGEGYNGELYVGYYDNDEPVKSIYHIQVP